MCPPEGSTVEGFETHFCNFLPLSHNSKVNKRKRKRSLRLILRLRIPVLEMGSHGKPSLRCLGGRQQWPHASRDLLCGGRRAQQGPMHEQEDACCLTGQAGIGSGRGEGKQLLLRKDFRFPNLGY